jgi:hypothetical protein
LTRSSQSCSLIRMPTTERDPRMFDEPDDAEDDWSLSYKPGADGLPEIDAWPPEDRLLPATPEHFVCLQGPCRHYAEQLLPSGDMVAKQELRRYCFAIPDEGGPNDLSDGSVFACSLYRPPWWSIDGWLWLWRQQVLLKEAREKIADSE